MSKLNRDSRSLWDDSSIKAMLERVRKNPPTKEELDRFARIKKVGKYKGRNG